MVDAILVGFSSAQYMIAGEANQGRNQVPMKATYAAIQFGEIPFIAIISVINALIALLFVVEVIRNRAWKGRTLFDYRDLKGLVIGTSRRGLENKASMERRLDEKGEIWIADPKDENVGSLEVLLEDKGGQIALILNGSESRGEL
jgi:hypothetical protein